VNDGRANTLKKASAMPMFNTNFVFSPGKLTVALDGSAGSSGKGKLGSFLCEHAGNWQFACNTFMPQAGHCVVLDDRRTFVYQTFNSCAYLTDRYEKLYIGPGATIELPAFWKELEQNNIPPRKIGISHLTAILQEIDTDYERGNCEFAGKPLSKRVVGGPLAATGSTAHGCGANRARRVLRDDSARYAHQVDKLQEFLCDVPREIMDRLDKGQSGLLEIAQGFQLSYLLPRFFPHTTSRNCTIAAGLDDLMVPPCYAGNVILNFRTFPIRINSKKYVDTTTGDHLTWDAVIERTRSQDPSPNLLERAGITLAGRTSGPGYPDQQELTWDELTSMSGSPERLMEMTTVTNLPRRVFTFSRMNVEEAIRHNRANGQVYLSLNFANYVDHAVKGQRARCLSGALGNARLERWLRENLDRYRPMLKFIGTGARTDDMIQMG
jgi:hypothetical protein